MVDWNITVNGWSMNPLLPASYPNSYTFVVKSGATADGDAGTVSLYTAPFVVPDGENFIAQDSVYHPGAIEQTVNLVNGHTYDLSFSWATGQQTGFSGVTNDTWEVSIGGNLLTSTPLTTNPSHGSTPWQVFNYAFTYTGTTSAKVLSFLDVCPPASSPGACDTGPGQSNGPPFSLLDNVSLTTGVPEPATWAMMALGFADLGFAGFRSRRRMASLV